MRNLPLQQDREQLLEQLRQCDGVTDWQLAFLITIVQREDFSALVLVNGRVDETFHRADGACRAFNTLWYDTKGALHLVRLGIGRVLYAISTEGESP